MAGGVIGAAWVQAIPTWAIAVAGIYGLSTWQRQQRGERHLKHAEKALAAGAEAFASVRAVRTRLIEIPVEESHDAAKRRAATLGVVNRRFERAWASWRRFQEHYLLAGLFSAQNASRPDLSREVADCLYNLQNHAEQVFTDWGDDRDLARREEIIKERMAFYGVTNPLGGLDPIEGRLQKAEAALQAELRPILNQPSPWSKVATAAKRRLG